MMSNSKMPRQYCTFNTPSAYGAARLSCPRMSLKHFGTLGSSTELSAGVTQDFKSMKIKRGS